MTNRALAKGSTRSCAKGSRRCAMKGFAFLRVASAILRVLSQGGVQESCDDWRAGCQIVAR
jgi:hypothetical protein